MIDEINELKINGYLRITVESTIDFISMAEKFGEIMPSRKNSIDKIDRLKVTTNRGDRSLSSKYSDKQFPFHTDGAYLYKPPRYIVLRSEDDIVDCPTILCRINCSIEDMETLQRDVWFVNGGRGKFYTSICSSEEDNLILRYDEDCMRPVFSVCHAQNKMQDLILKGEKIKIEWRKNLAVIVDNWKILHARSDARNYHNRILQRIWIK